MAVTSSPFTLFAGTAVVEFDVRKALAVEPGQRLDVRADRNGAARGGFGRGARVGGELLDKRPRVERVSADVDRIAVARLFHGDRDIVVPVQLHAGKFGLRQGAACERHRALDAKGFPSRLKSESVDLPSELSSTKLDIGRDARALGPAGPRNAQLGAGQVGFDHLLAVALGIERDLHRAFDEVGNPGHQLFARLVVQRQLDDALASGRSSPLPSGSIASISAAAPLSLAFAAITALLRSITIVPSASVTIWPSSGFAIDRFL